VHVSDAARLFRLAVERGTAGATYHAADKEVEVKWIAEVIGKKLNLPVKAVTSKVAEKTSDFWLILLGWMGWLVLERRERGWSGRLGK
jgi:nucleoside-diphosphate-sugar epimerase